MALHAFVIVMVASLLPYFIVVGEEGLAVGLFVCFIVGDFVPFKVLLFFDTVKGEGEEEAVDAKDCKFEGVEPVVEEEISREETFAVGLFEG